MLLTSFIGDCHDSAGHKDMCVTGAINNYTMQLASAYQETNLKLQCKFLKSLGPMVVHEIIW